MRLRLAVCACVLLAAGRAGACQVPVFRFALEQWQPGRYELLVFHRGPLGPEAKALLDELEKRGERLNVLVTPVDLDQKPLRADRKAVWESQKDTALPRAVLRMPNSTPEMPPVWSGPLEEKALRAVTASAARAELAARLTKGESAVFVLLESGDRKADDAAAKMLGGELARLGKVLKLPEQDPLAEGPKVVSPLPLHVKFSVLRVRRDDAAEQALVRCLLAGEQGLAEAKGPVVFPVFGRGRVLTGLHGDLLEPAVVEEVGRFLCGQCSCTVKELNPGWDLLTDFDWHAAVFPEPKR